MTYLYLKPNVMKTVLFFTAGILVYSCSSPEKPPKPEPPVVAEVAPQPVQQEASEASVPKEAPSIPQPVVSKPKHGWPDPIPNIEPSPEPDIYDYVEEQPEFPGGMEACKTFLARNIRYPEEAREMAIEGKCYIRFVVSDAGKISDVQVVKGVPGGQMCDREAVRVVKMMPDWKPGKMEGKAVNCYMVLPVTFKLTE